MLKRLLFLLAVSFITGTLVAQVTTSTLTGSVKGQGDEPLVGATITATHEPSGTRYQTTSRSNGEFIIQNMRVGGPYKISITFIGYENQLHDEVYLKLAESFLLDAIMTKSNTTLENVVLTASGRRNPILNANRTGAVTNLDRRAIERMPSIVRSLNDLTRVTPQSNGVSIGGGNFRQNNFTIDGADFNNSFGISTGGAGNLPAGGSPVSLDAIDEISISITPFDVRQSGFIGSAINAVTRAGTNTFSGSVYTYFRSEKHQGNKVEKTTFVKSPFEFKMYGARLGGPIIKNKLFFFLNFETENSPVFVQPRNAATPGAPFGSSPNIARPTRAELDAISTYLKTTYGYDTGPYDGYTGEKKLDKYLARVDWNINNRHQFNARFSHVEGGNPAPPSTSTTGSNFLTPSGYTNRQDINSLWFKNSNYFQGNDFTSVAAELNSKIGKSFSNTLRATYTFQNEVRETESTSFPFVDILQNNQTFTSFGYEPFSWGNLREVKMWSFIDNLSFSVKKHNWTFGVQADMSETVNGFQRFGRDFYVFNNWNDFITGAKPINFATTFSYLPDFAQAFPKFEFAQYSVYGQDEINVGKKVRLTFGLRVDFPRYKKVDEIQTNPFILAVNFEGGKKLDTGVLPETKSMWSPRLGFNYDVFGDRSLQIRGGTGIFTGKVPFVWIVSQSGDNGMLQTTIGINGQANTPGPFNDTSGHYWPSTLPAKGSIIPSGTSVMSPDYKFPQVWKSSLAMDKKLPWNMIMTIEAIFNRDLQTPYFQQVNLVAPQPLNIAGYPDNRNVWPGTSASTSTNNSLKYINPILIDPRNGSSVFVPTGYVAASPTSVNAFNAIEMVNGTKGYYGSLSIQIVKPFLKGFNGSISFTKSIASNLFDGGGDQPLSAWQGTSTVNGSNQAKLAAADYVIPNRLSANVSYRKEYLKHLATTISVFYNGASGGRWSYTYGADFNRDGQNGNDLIYIPKNAMDPNEIQFSSFTYNGVTYSATQQAELFENYIKQDKYLRNHRGQYAERNGAQVPWRNQVDIRVLQDLFVNVGKYRNTIQFSIDIFNFGNLLNPSWGKVKTVNTPGVLVPTNVTTNTAGTVIPYTPGGTQRPLFRLATDRNLPVTRTFRDNVSIASTYFMQFGIRYIFN